MSGQNLKLGVPCRIKIALRHMSCALRLLQLQQLKSELDDAKASCELHKTRVKTLVDGQLSAQMTGEVGAEDPYRSSESSS